MNRVTLVGRLTRDPELRKTQSGLSVVSFTVAVDRQHKKDEEKSADFISCQAWRQSAEYLSNYGAKGCTVAVDGHISTRSYDDRDGKKVYVTEVVADSVQLLESRSQSQNQSRPDSFPAYTPDPGYNTGADSFSADDFNTGPSLDISSDDLPF